MKPLGTTEILGKYLRQVLRPFVRWALHHGLRLPDVVETLRLTFVEVAAEEIRRVREKPTVSRLSVATGMSRRDVQRASTGEGFRDITLSLPTRVISLWLSHKDFRSKQGKPRVLSCHGPESEFAALVKLVTQDVHPASVLFELERVGAIARTSKGIQLKTEGYIPADPEQGIRMLSQDLEQLLYAVDENLFAQLPDNNLHVRTVSSHISMTDAPIIRDWLLREGGAFHRRVRDFLSEYDRQLNPQPNKQPTAQIVITSFGRLSQVKPPP